MITPESPREGLELAVVGTALVNPRNFEKLAQIVEPGMIRYPPAKAIWEALAERIPQDLPVDYAALHVSIPASVLDQIGGPVVFSQVAEFAAGDGEWHARELRDRIAQQKTSAKLRSAVDNFVDDPEAARAALLEAVAENGVDDWDEPVRLAPPAPPVLDVKLLGGIGEMAQAVADSLQVPVDIPAWFGMAAASAAVGGRRTVSPKPDWSEPVTLYCMTVAAPGEKKSPSRSVMVAPLAEEERRRQAEDRFAVARDQQERRIAEACVAAAEALVIKAKTVADRKKSRDNLDAVRSELENLGEPKVPTQMLADDTTPEAAAGVMAEQGERLAVISAEGGFLSNIGGRYSNQPNLEIVLKAWSHEPHTVNRKNGPPMFLTRPNLTLALAVQPGMLTGLGDMAEVFEARGFTGRFIFSVPASKVGQRTYDTIPIPESVRHSYGASIGCMVAAVWDDSEVREMRLDEDAQAIFKAFWEEWERRHLVPGDLTSVEGWSKKLPGQLLRLAAVMTLFDAPECMTVSGETMANAVGLVPYLLTHARLVVDLMSAEKQSKLGPARAVLDWLRRKHPEGALTAEDVKRGVAGQSWFEDTESVRQALDVLERHGWIRWLPAPEPTGRRGRPPAPRFVTHPRVLEPPR